MGASCQVVLPVSRLPTKQGAASSGEENRLKGNGRASFARFDEHFAVWGKEIASVFRASFFFEFAARN